MGTVHPCFKLIPSTPRIDFVGVDLSQIIDGKATCHGIGMRLKFPADQVMLETGLTQFEGCINIIGKNGDALNRCEYNESLA